MQLLESLRESIGGVRDSFLLKESKIVEADTRHNILSVVEMIYRVKNVICKHKKNIRSLQIDGTDSFFVFFCNDVALGVRAAPETCVPLLTFVASHHMETLTHTKELLNLKEMRYTSTEDLIDRFIGKKGRLSLYEMYPALLNHVMETVYFKEVLQIHTSESPITAVLKALAACSHSGTIYIVQKPTFHIIVMENGTLKEAFFWGKKTVIEGIEAFHKIFSLKDESNVVVLEKREYPFGEWFIFLANSLFEKFRSLYGAILTKEMEREICNFIEEKKYHEISIKENQAHVADTFKVRLYPQYCEILKKQLTCMSDVMGASTVRNVFDSLVSKLDENGQFFFEKVITSMR